MNAATQVICSCALTFGIPIVIAGWELWRLGPSKRDLPPGDDSPALPTPLPDAGASPRIQKPLPDCLIPRPAPARIREFV
jgi:hypothetical protein